MSGPDLDPVASRTLTYLAIIVVAIPLLIVSLLSWQLHWDWASNLWFGYTWPSLKGNGPEALVQTIVYGAIAVVLIPPVRKAIEKFAKRHVDSIKAHVSAEHDALHDKVDHLIKHTHGVPETHSDGSDFMERPKL
jgi:hypothetical protein